MNTTQCECALCEREHQSRLVVLESIVKCLLDLCKHNTNAHTRAHIAQHVKCVPSLFQNCVNAPTITTTVSLCSTRECAHRLIYMQFFSAHVLRTRERLNEVIHQFNAHKHRYFVRGVHVFFSCIHTSAQHQPRSCAYSITALWIEHIVMVCMCVCARWFASLRSIVVA